MGEEEYGWKVKLEKYSKGTFLLGMNFNTNVWDDGREIYLCIYLGKIALIIGKFH